MRLKRKLPIVMISTAILLQAGCAPSGDLSVLNNAVRPNGANTETTQSQPTPTTEAPTDFATVGMTTTPTPMAQTWQSTTATTAAPKQDYILQESNTRYLVDADVAGLTAAECRIAKNEIYARHGRKFNSEELKQYFAGKPWYQGTIEPDAFPESRLNEFEKKNVVMLQEWEKVAGTGSKSSVKLEYSEADNSLLHVRNTKWDYLMYSMEYVGETENYYKLRIGHCYIPTTSKSKMKGKKVGDNVQIGDRIYRVTETNGDDYYGVKDAKSGTEGWLLLSFSDDTFAIRMVYEDYEDWVISEEDRRGYAYLSKTADIGLLGNDDNTKHIPVSAGDFANGKWKNDSRYYQGSAMVGGIKVDENGIITAYRSFYDD